MIARDWPFVGEQVRLYLFSFVVITVIHAEASNEDYLRKTLPFWCSVFQYQGLGHLKVIFVYAKTLLGNVSVLYAKMIYLWATVGLLRLTATRSATLKIPHTGKLYEFWWRKARSILINDNGARHCISATNGHQTSNNSLGGLSREGINLNEVTEVVSNNWKNPAWEKVEELAPWMVLLKCNELYICHVCRAWHFKLWRAP